MNSILDAAYHTVHDYPGGVAALATRLPRKAESTLNQEVRPPTGSMAKLGIVDAAAIVTATNDYRIADAFCAHVGGMFVRFPTLDDDQADVPMAQLVREFSDVLSELARTLDDGAVNDNELRAARREWSELVAVGNSIVATLAARNLAQKPLSERGRT